MTRPANDKHFDQHHEYSREEGYKPAEYEHQEYPKVVGKDDDGNEVIANNEEEEDKFFDGQENSEPVSGKKK